MSNNEIYAMWSARVLTSVFCGRSKTLFKIAVYGVMSMFVSCGVGAQDFTASPEALLGSMTATAMPGDGTFAK